MNLDKQIRGASSLKRKVALPWGFKGLIAVCWEGMYYDRISILEILPSWNCGTGLDWKDLGRTKGGESYLEQCLWACRRKSLESSVVRIKLQICVEHRSGHFTRQLDTKIWRWMERSGLFLQKAKRFSPCTWIPYLYREKQTRPIVWHHEGKPTH